MKKRIAVILSLVGITLFLYYFFHIGPETIARLVKRISIAALMSLLLLRCLYWLLKTLCWWRILNTYTQDISFLTLLRVHLSGNSVAYLNPTGRIGGEVFRFLLMKQVGKKKLLASIAVDKALEWLAGSMLIIVALIIAFFRNILTPWAVSIGCLTLIAAAIMILLLLLKKGSGVISGIYTGIARMAPNSRMSGYKERVREVEALILGFYHQNKRRFFSVLFAYLLKGFFWAFEIFFTFMALGAMDVGYIGSFLLATLGSVAFLFPSLPGGVGVYEGTYASLTALLGIGMATGLALVIVRRVIGLFWAGLGFIPFFFSRKEIGDSSH